MVGHGGSSAGSYLADPTSPIPSHCASIAATSTLRVKSAYQWMSPQVARAAVTYLCRSLLRDIAMERLLTCVSNGIKSFFLQETVDF